MRLLASILVVITLAACSSGTDAGDDAAAADGAGDNGSAGAGTGTGTGTDGPCAAAEVDGQQFTLVSADESVSARGTVPESLSIATAEQPCEVAIVDLLATTGENGELASLGFAVDMGPLLRDSIDDLAAEAAGLLVGEGDELILDEATTVSDLPARRLEIALAGSEDTLGGRGLLVFVAAGDQVLTLTAIALAPDFDLARPDIDSVIASLDIAVGG
ncbi:MAG: hypothetical protein RIE08_02130 [Acidimicrobiales bacterium]